MTVTSEKSQTVATNSFYGVNPFTPIITQLSNNEFLKKMIAADKPRVTCVAVEDYMGSAAKTTAHHSVQESRSADDKSESDLTTPRQTENIIIIDGLPKIKAPALNDSAFLQICHDMKHFYCDGEYEGLQFATKKAHTELALANEMVRINFTYTGSWKDDKVTIRFMQDNASEAVRIRRVNPNAIRLDVIKSKYLRKYKGRLYVATPLSKAEQNFFANLFSIQCTEVIQQHIDQVYADSMAQKIDPKEIDYYDPDVLDLSYRKRSWDDMLSCMMS